MTDKELRNYIIENLLIDEEDEILLSIGYAEAFLGVTDLEPKRAVYDKQKMIEILMKEDKCSYEEAIEWLDNTWNAYVGEKTPLYINTVY